MTIRARWKKTSIANKMLVFVGAAAAFVSSLSLVSTVAQIYLANDSQKQASDRTDRILSNINWLAKEMHFSVEQSRRLIESSERQSQDALNASIAASREDQRAWVGLVDITDIQFQVGLPVQFTYVIQNTGKSPAIDMEFDSNTFGISSSQRFRPKYLKRPKGSKITLQPTIRKEIPVREGISGFNPMPLNDVGIKQLQSGIQTYYLFGKIDYSDVFKRRHHTTFCLYLAANLKDVAYCSEYNKSD